jgi:hypothetical protein
MEAVVARHQATAHATRAGVMAMGLSLWPESEYIATACCTAVNVPRGATAQEIVSTLRSKYGVMISGGYGELTGKLFRLGHMGLSAHPTLAIAQLGMLEQTLVTLGVDIPRGAGMSAALERFAGWDDSTLTYPGLADLQTCSGRQLAWSGIPASPCLDRQYADGDDGGLVGHWGTAFSTEIPTQERQRHRWCWSRQRLACARGGGQNGVSILFRSWRWRLSPRCPDQMREVAVATMGNHDAGTPVGADPLTVSNCCLPRRNPETGGTGSTHAMVVLPEDHRS